MGSTNSLLVRRRLAISIKMVDVIPNQHIGIEPEAKSLWKIQIVLRYCL
jgi:hypothetical protein